MDSHRRAQERDLEIPNSLNYTSSVIQESPLKLPLAPILSTPPDRRINPALSGRRGTSIFSPVQTLDPPENQNPPHHHHHRQLSPPPLQHPVAQREPSPDSPPPPAPPPQAAAAEPVRYRECLKNHAANMGGHVVDGCGEFMPGGDEGTTESFHCAACDCHRNFHRKEVDGEPPYPHPYAYNHAIQRPPLLHPAGQANYSAPPHRQPHLHKHSHGAPPTMFNFGSGGAAAESSSEDLNMFGQSSGGHAVLQPSHSRKRFRTKFSQDQKDRMQEFAARIGWRIQKQDEEEVQRFCAEVGVKRQVFKVWMHNNKQAMKRRQN